ncbi:MAG: hypothetical protein ACLTBV_29985 [Enterocloster bolteae]
MSEMVVGRKVSLVCREKTPGSAPGRTVLEAEACFSEIPCGRPYPAVGGKRRELSQVRAVRLRLYCRN